MKTFLVTIFIFVTFNLFGQVGENNDAIGIQLGGSLLLFNDCCFESRIHSDPDLEMGYRLGIISRHTSGERFYHDFQLSYSKEKIGYTSDRRGDINQEYLNYEAYHFIYYFGYRIKKELPLTVYVGHNFGHIIHNHGDRVE